MKQTPSEGEALSRFLWSQVFPTLTEEVTPTESKSKLKKNDFDLEHFQRLMARDGWRFENEQEMFWNCLPLQMKKMDLV